VQPSAEIPPWDELPPTLPPDHVDFSFGGVTVRITEDGNVNITGAKNLAFEGEKISFHATESLDMNVDGDVYIGTSTHLILQAPRIDQNPDKDRKTGYKVADKIKKLIRTFENYYPSWRDPEGMYVEKPRAAVPQCKCGKCSASES
jgi:hypothetical protein